MLITALLRYYSNISNLLWKTMVSPRENKGEERASPIHALFRSHDGNVFREDGLRSEYTFPPYDWLLPNPFGICTALRSCSIGINRFNRNWFRFNLKSMKRACMEDARLSSPFTLSYVWSFLYVRVTTDVDWKRKIKSRGLPPMWLAFECLGWDFLVFCSAKKDSSPG